MNTSLQAVFFDLDGTLRSNQPSWNAFFNDCLAALEPRLDSPERRRRILRWDLRYWAQSPAFKKDMAAFGDDDAAFWRNYCRRRLRAWGFGPSRSAGLAAEIWGCFETSFQPSQYVAEDVRPTLAALQAAGLTIGLISNRRRNVDALLEELDLRRYLDFVVISGEVGVSKPDPAIFHHALRLADVAAAAAFYVGDNYFADVVGARRANLQPVLLDPERLFPEADCPVIARLADLLPLLGLTV